MSGASTVSYAQAAMGAANPPSQNSTGNKDKDGQQQQTQNPPKAASSTSEPMSTQAKKEVDVAPTAADVVKVSDANETITNGHYVLVAGDQGDMIVDDSSALTDVSSIDGNKASVASAATSSQGQRRSATAPRGKKGRQSHDIELEQDGPQDAETTKDAPKLELAEAPIPAVNIWQQRQEAHLAKTKSVPKLSKSMELNGPLPADSKNKVSEPRKNARPAVDPETSAPTQTITKPPRKGDAARSDSDVNRRNGHRGPRSTEKDIESQSVGLPAPPPVDDASMWPTPDTATKEDKRKTVEKSERTDKEKDKDRDREGSEDAAPQKGKSKKWIDMDFVPSVVFNTPIPSTRGSRGRGGARGGARDVAPRTGHGGATGSAIGEKGSATSTSLTRAGTDGSGREREREREREGEERERDPHSQRETGASTARSSSLPPTSLKRASTDNVSGQDRRDGRKQHAAPADRNKDAAVNGVQNQSHQGRDRTEGRSERSRGGFRGRGGHHGPSSQAHSATSGQANGTEFRVQTNLPNRPPAPFSPQGKQSGFGPQPNGNNRSRGGHRASLVSHTRVGSQQPNGIAHHRMSLPQAYEFPQMQSSINAIAGFPAPYGISPEGFTLLKSQIEYYFSIENLCKDIWLRRHMDTLGFVPLSVIASFKRILDITDNLDIVGHACEESSHIEIVVSEHRGEFIRRGSEWQLFVLPVHERMDFAKNDGPVDTVARARLQMSFVNPWYPLGGFHATSGTMYANANGGDHAIRSPVSGDTFHVPASNGYVPDTPLSATVSEFSPLGFAGQPQPHNPPFPPNQANGIDAVVNGTAHMPATNDDSHHFGMTNGVARTEQSDLGATMAAGINGVSLRD